MFAAAFEGLDEFRWVEITVAIGIRDAPDATLVAAFVHGDPEDALVPKQAVRPFERNIRRPDRCDFLRIYG